jgi:3',5'-cyclic AMP phosphodiesterase CpdA
MRIGGARVTGFTLGTWLLAFPGMNHAIPPRMPVTTSPHGANVATIVAAGDIACDPKNSLFNAGRGSGDYCRAAAVEKVIQAVDPDAVLPLGDVQYDDGRLSAFEKSYDRSWGRQRHRTFPVPGNHEYYGRGNAYGYFSYFGDRAGPKGRGWYSVKMGTWRLIALNSNCGYVGCRGGSPQYGWLRHVLIKRPAPCTLAFMHHPLISSGPHGDDEAGARPLWRVLYHFGVDVALTGHDHIYERFAPVNAFGVKDKRHGIREFVVGTGGAMHYPIDHVHQYSQVRNTKAFGVLQLTLRSGSYDWRFRPAAGASFTDGGTTRCHGAP